MLTEILTKRRSLGVIIAVILLIAIVLTGTFAFILPFQHRSNELGGDGVRHDATLNENFEPVTGWTVRDPEVTKQINVTNTGNNTTGWGSVFVRINLREFMEIYDTTFFYWEVAADGTIDMVHQADMDERATLFMTDSNNLAGDPSRVFVVCTEEASIQAGPGSSILSDSAGTAATNILINYPHLFPNMSASNPADVASVESRVVRTIDYVSGVFGWFVISQEGDLHGQYGRPMVADVKDSGLVPPQIIGTPTTPRAENVDYGTHEPNGECDYDIHQWQGITNATLPNVEGNFAAPTTNYRDWIMWTLGENVILHSQWDNEPVDAWIIDDRAGETDGWVYWGRALAVGETTANFLETVTLLNQPVGDFYYVIHTHMESVSLASLSTWPRDFWTIGGLTTDVDVSTIPIGESFEDNAGVKWLVLDRLATGETLIIKHYVLEWPPYSIGVLTNEELLYLFWYDIGSDIQNIARVPHMPTDYRESANDNINGVFPEDAVAGFPEANIGEDGTGLTAPTNIPATSGSFDYWNPENGAMFTLSVGEAGRYFADDDARVAFHIGILDQSAEWQLRTPGAPFGWSGTLIHNDGSFNTFNPNNRTPALRPAMWVMP